jgi:hypothetical protein
VWKERFAPGRDDEEAGVNVLNAALCGKPNPPCAALSQALRHVAYSRGQDANARPSGRFQETGVKRISVQEMTGWAGSRPRERLGRFPSDDRLLARDGAPFQRCLQIELRQERLNSGRDRFETGTPGRPCIADQDDVVSEAGQAVCDGGSGRSAAQNAHFCSDRLHA